MAQILHPAKYLADPWAVLQRTPPEWRAAIGASARAPRRKPSEMQPGPEFGCFYQLGVLYHKRFRAPSKSFGVDKKQV